MPKAPLSMLPLGDYTTEITSIDKYRIVTLMITDPGPHHHKLLALSLSQILGKEIRITVARKKYPDGAIKNTITVKRGK